MAIGKYDTIEKITFEDGAITFFLVDSDKHDYDCDLFSELWFNEFKESQIKRKYYCNVSSMVEVLDFLKAEEISYESFYKNGILKAGGDHDMNIYGDLSYEWEV